MLAVDQHGSFRSADARMPAQQLGLIGVRGEAVDCMDFSAYRYLSAQQIYGARSVDDAPCRRATRREPDENHTRRLTWQVVHQVMTHPTAGAHARAGHDHGPAADAIDFH